MATTTAFELTSLDGTPPAELARRLRVVPTVTLALSSTSGATARLVPASRLRPSTLYRFSLVRANGTPEASWAAQTAGPLRLVETIPGDGATAVRRDAGIELVFDQPGVAPADLLAHLRIQPATEGHMEVAGRSIAYVPDRPLRRATLYTVTVTGGLLIAGTDQRLAKDATFRFETLGTVPSPITVRPLRDFIEATPRSAAAFATSVDGPDDFTPPARVPVTVHRLSGMATAERAWRAIVAAPTWTQVTTAPAVSTAGLPEVLDRRLPLRGGEDGTWIRLPRPLPAGWYVVTVAWAGIPRQTVLQVTDLATYAMVTTTRSLAWVNDLRTGDPVAGATVTLGTRALGRTRADGLVTSATPAAMRAPTSDDLTPLLEVRRAGRTAFLPIAGRRCPECDDPAAGDAWWQFLTSDRYQYRSTDTVNAWGIARDRATGDVPASLRVSLVIADGDAAGAPAISTTTVRPDARGAYTASVPLRALPAGSYRLIISAGRRQLSELWLDIGTITKPAYRLAITTDHRAVMAGDTVQASVHGSFFEGTPVAGASLRLEAEEGSTSTVTTDASGDAEAPISLGIGGGQQWTIVSVDATAALPEEAFINTSTAVAVFRGSAVVDTEGVLAGRRLTLTGRVSNVDFARFDAVAPGDLWSVDPRGAVRPGAAVSLRVVEHWSLLRQVGTRYDFVLKRAAPVFRTSERRAVLATRAVVTGPDGTYRLVLPVRGGKRSYEIRATYVDEAGRTIAGDTWAYGREPTGGDVSPHLTVPGPVLEDERTYSIGDSVRVRFEGGTERPRVTRHLFTVLQDGLRDATLRASATYHTTFAGASVPAIQIRGVRFTGYGYEEAGAYDARLRLADRHLAVSVTSDQARYTPGGVAHLTVRTLDGGGKAVQASVFVQAVDEKLFATGEAGTSDPIDALYAELDDGLIATARSHQTPGDDFGDGKDGGDTTGGGGGGDRGAFSDWLVGRLLRTGPDGIATIDVPLSDDLTSWHVTAQAVDARLEAGLGELLLPVGLPFFAEATIPASMVVADRPVIRVRAFGADLHAGDPVTFTVSSDSLPMAPVTVTGTAYRAVEVPLAPLSLGTHRIRIQATAGPGGTYHDALVRTVDVVASRAEREETSWAPLLDRTPVVHGAGMTRLLLADAGRGRAVPVLQDLASGGSGRSDLVLSAALARRVLAEAFSVDTTTSTGDPDIAPFMTDEGLVAIVPWGGGDLDATALAAMSGDPGLDPLRLRDALTTIAYDEAELRPRRLLALAGLAGLGDPVLADVRAAAAQPDLTITERVNVALAALFAGDEDLARTIEGHLLSDHGSHLGPWTRLDIGPAEDQIVQTARLAIVAASLGEPVAIEMETWVAANPPRATTVALERALAARGWAIRVAGAPAVAAITVDGTRRELTVDPGSVASVVLTPAQAGSAVIEPVSGSLLVVTSRTVGLDAGSLTAPAGMTLERTVSPAGQIGPTDTAEVTLRVKLGPGGRDECWRLVDLVPSGLAPVGVGWQDDDGNVVGPDRIEGQRVEFCVVPDSRRPVQEFRYIARVVDPGSYAWEPAVLQSSIVPDQGVTTSSQTVSIAGAGG